MYIDASCLPPLPIDSPAKQKETVKTHPPSIAQHILSIIFYVVISFILAMSVPRLFGCHFVTIETGSMEPALPIGSACLIKPVTIEDLKIGDIITFQATDGENEIIVTHRILFEGTNAVYTKGDANEVVDKKPIGQDRLIGKVLFHLPMFGYIFKLLDIWIVKLILIAVIGILFTGILLLERKQSTLLVGR